VRRPDRPGYIRGRHYSEYRARVEELKRAERWDEAATLLNEVVAAAKAEAAATKEKPPWYRRAMRLARRSRLGGWLAALFAA
jgi:hypothetical protein